MANLISGLGGAANFGENFLARNDDNFTSFIDLRSVFGVNGINFFGQQYTGLFLNNNGSVTFASGRSTYTPEAITGQSANPIIAPFWADVDTRNPVSTVTPGGTSTGSNLLWYDLDSANRVFTATWDDVGFYSQDNSKLNAFQLRLQQVGTMGDFDIEFRYEEINWTTGDASSGSNGLGGVPARAGYSSGNGVNFFELSQSGNQNALLGLESASNVGEAGVFRFSVRSGSASPTISVAPIEILEGNDALSRFAFVPVSLAAPSSQTITVQYSTANGTALAGNDYLAQSGVLTFAPG